MIVYYINPFPVRGVIAPYLWVFYKILATTKEPVSFILSEDYLNPPEYWQAQKRWDCLAQTQKDLGYNISKDFEKIRNHDCYFIDNTIWDTLLTKNQSNLSTTFHSLLTENHELLIAKLISFIEEINNKSESGKHIEAIVTWCNNPSLSMVAQQYNLPLIHQELGPLRSPLYQERCYFDFQGVNGNTQAKALYQSSSKDYPIFTQEQLFAFFANSSQYKNKRIYIGVVLQVEDDSNVIAFSKGWNNITLLNYVKSRYQNDPILVRVHPGSLFTLKEPTHVVIDNSKNSIEFLSKCKKIITINSSIGFEAMLQGIETECLGDSSFKFLENYDNIQQRQHKLNFYTWCYLIPKACQLNNDYIRFRVTNPSNREIFLYHLNITLGLDMNADPLVELLKINNDIENKNKELIQQYSKLEVKNKELLINLKHELTYHRNTSLYQAQEIVLSNNELLKKQDYIDSQICEINRLNDIIHKLSSSASWKITRPLRFTRLMLSKPKQAINQLKNFINRFNQRSFQEELPLDRSQAILEKYLVTKNTLSILTTQHCLFVANELAAAFELFGYTRPAITTEQHNYFDNHLYIIFAPQAFEQLPKNYIVFQMEQSINPRWFSKNYLKILNNAWAIFDYSMHNIAFLQKQGIPFSQIYYLPIGAQTFDYIPVNDKPIDILFYGDNHCSRRSTILDALTQKFNIEIVNNLFGDELSTKIKQAKIILNIHYYDDALLETTRIYECLSYGTLIISEKSKDQSTHSSLENIIDFVDINAIDQFEARLNYWLSHQTLLNERLKKNQQLLSSSFKHMEFFLGRFLLAHDIIEFNTFYQLVGRTRKLIGNRHCLGLPEALERKKSFQNDNQFQFEYFFGLRHKLGWIGCGLSYKYLMTLASEQNLQNILICEDDVAFPHELEKKLTTIEHFLTTEIKQWDVFSGLIAEIDDSYTISNVYQEKDDMQFIEINKSVSMVMNFYNNTAYQYYMNWDDTYRDVYQNTIDRYVEAQSHIHTFTVLPFLVGHKEDLNSTLWGANNTTYSAMIVNSQQKLNELIYTFKIQS